MTKASASTNAAMEVAARSKVAFTFMIDVCTLCRMKLSDVIHVPEVGGRRWEER